MIIHSLFDVLALLAALAVYCWVPIAAPAAPGQPWQSHPLYLAVASLGATIGAYLAGSANLWLTGVDGLARSIEGALAGGILGVEVLKASAGLRGSTGLRFVAPLAVAIAVGRIGCFVAGLDDMTYGTPTSLPWGIDFGDGIPRHPVQLYESAAMAIFLVWFLRAARGNQAFVLRAGFYLFIGCFVAGLDDMTYGTPTSLPWGIHFGDGIPRHPVQLYESAAMAIFLGWFLRAARGNQAFVLRAGFYLFIGVYAAQRFLWEFLKPYGTVLGPFNLFHLLSAALILYAVVFARREMQWTSQSSAPQSA